MDFPTRNDAGKQLPVRPLGIAFDLDGTLLDYDGVLSESVANSVRLFTNAGVKVFLVTGRLQSSAEEYWRELGLDTPLACCNGAYVGFPGADPFLHLRLGEEARRIILDLEERHGLYVNYYIDNRVYARHDSLERDWYSRNFAPVEHTPERVDIMMRNLPTKCLCITTAARQPEISALLRQALGAEATVTQSSERFIEIVSPEANKGVGLRALADWAGIPVDRCIAAGDAMNDLPMFQEAGLAITFQSSDSRLFDHVDMVLPPLWEGGMKILAKRVLGMTDSGRLSAPRSKRLLRK